MATVIPSPQTRQRHSVPQPVAAFNPLLRFTVAEAAGLLKQSVSKTWVDIRENKLSVIREGGRVFVPGSEIVRRSSLPQQPGV
jgi:hypothetical protein